MASASTAPEIDASGIADLVGHVGGQAPDGGQAVGLAHALLHLLDRGQVLADADETRDLSVAGAQGPERDADGDEAPVLPPERELVAPRGRLVFVRRLPDLVEVDAGPEDRAPRLTQGIGRPESRDRLGGAVERGHVPAGIDAHEPGAHRFEDQVAKRLEVRQVLSVRVQVRLGLAVPAGQGRRHEADDEEDGGVQADRERFIGRRARCPRRRRGTPARPGPARRPRRRRSTGRRRQRRPPGGGRRRPPAR